MSTKRAYAQRATPIRDRVLPLLPTRRSAADIAREVGCTAGYVEVLRNANPDLAPTPADSNPLIASEFPVTESRLHFEDRDRFLSKIEAVEGDENTCWRWTGSLHKEWGYGHFKVTRGRMTVAHRVALEMATGTPIPDGLLALHRCGKGHLGCVRPSHLYAGTQKQNCEDRARHGTTARGERGGRAKFTESQANEAIALAAAGASISAVGRRVGVSRTQAGAIIYGRSWKHLERHPEVQRQIERWKRGERRPSVFERRAGA